MLKEAYPSLMQCPELGLLSRSSRGHSKGKTLAQGAQDLAFTSHSLVTLCHLGFRLSEPQFLCLNNGARQRNLLLEMN